MTDFELHWLDQMWHSGYCEETIQFSSTTALDTAGSKQRLEWMHEHVPGCSECQFANTFKDIEASVAKELGFLEHFQHGGDVTKLEGFEAALAQHLVLAIRKGQINKAILVWMEAAMTRRGRIWPGRLQ